MAQAIVKTNRLRRIKPARAVVGYRWRGEKELTMLACGHDMENHPGLYEDEDEPIWLRCPLCPGRPPADSSIIPKVVVTVA